MTEAAKAMMRRRKLARRTYKTSPVFAMAVMRESYPDYTLEQLWEDLKLRGKRKKKVKKNPLKRYGRYMEMDRLIRTYHMSGDVDDLLKAQQLRNKITQPYRLKVRYGSEEKVYTYPATYPHRVIAQLAAMARTCDNFEEFEIKAKKTTQYLPV